MDKNQLQEFFESESFTVHFCEEGEVELETWTQGGVNMVIHLEPFTAEEFESYVYDFDVDGEIDLHREGESYKSAFTIRESLEDFESFHGRLKETMERLKAKLG